jgi:flagellar biosynthesis anti-sigma factor FlgM
MVTDNTEVVVEATQTQELQDEHGTGERAVSTEDNSITKDKVVEAEMLNTLVATTSFPLDNDDRTAAIKRAIANGSYRIDPRRIAEKIMSFEFLLGRKNID